MSEMEQVRAAIAALAETINRHEMCTWEQVGPCVYCADHNVRLYNGVLPEGRRQPRKP